MMNSIANLLEFLGIAFSPDMDPWTTSSTDEELVRAIARGYTHGMQQALLRELDILLARQAPPAELIAIAQQARVAYVLDEANVREWFSMIRDQVRVVAAASA